MASLIQYLPVALERIRFLRDILIPAKEAYNSTQDYHHAEPLSHHHGVMPINSIAAIVRRRGHTPIEFTEVPVPQLGPFELLIKLSHSGVCGTDNAIFTGKLGASDGVTGFISPHVGGHEGIGIIIAMGPTTSLGGNFTAPKRTKEFKIGQRVGIRWTWKICEQFTYCRLGRGDLCTSQKATGVHEHGTFQQYCKIHISCAVRIPEGVTSASAAAMMCAGSAAFNAVKQTRDLIPSQPGTIAIIGAGGSIGHIAIQFAWVFGFDVIAIDKGTQKENLCLKKGAMLYLGWDLSSTEQIADSIRKSTMKEGHSGVEAVIVASGGCIAPFQLALDIIRPLGVMMVVGNPSPEPHLEVNVPMALILNIKIVHTLMGGTQVCEESLSYLASGQIQPHVQMRSLDDLTEILAEIGRGETLGKVVVRIL